MNTAKQARHNKYQCRINNELISIVDWKDDRLFTGRLKRLGIIDDFIAETTLNHSDCDNKVWLSFGDWHDFTEIYINKHIQMLSEKWWVNSDNNCPELINVNSDYTDLAVILPEPYLSEREKGNLYRISYYGDGGSTTHSVYKTFFDAVYECAGKGYLELKPGMLDSLVGTLKWNRGGVVSAACQSGVWLQEYLDTIATEEERSYFL